MSAVFIFFCNLSGGAGFYRYNSKENFLPRGTVNPQAMKGGNISAVFLHADYML
jgi:hypothetical protein